MATTKKVEKLRVAMLEARAAYSEFMETHSRPMTPEEIEANEPYASVFSSPFVSPEETSIPKTIELTLEQAKEIKKITDVMLDAQKTFYREFMELKKGDKDETISHT